MSSPAVPGVPSSGGSGRDSNNGSVASASHGGKLAVVAPPSHYAIVEDDVFRCAYPGTASGRFLGNLRLRTVVLLSLEALPMQSRRMLEGQGAAIVNLGEDAWATRNNFDLDMIAKALQLLLDADTHPILLTCATGELQTSAVVGALRRLQGWPLSSVDSELRQFNAGSSRSHRTAILEAVERFDHSRFYATVVFPRLVAQKRALEAADAFNRALQQQAASSTGGDSTESPEAQVASSSLDEMTPALAAPLPLWYLRHLRHALTAGEQDNRPSNGPLSSTDAAVTGSAGGAPLSLAEAIRRQAQAVRNAAANSGGGRQAPAYEKYRNQRLPPLISDRSGYSKAESLVDSDDD